MGEESRSDCIESTFGINLSSFTCEVNIHFLSVSETRATCFVPSCPVSSSFLMSISVASSHFWRQLHHLGKEAVPLVTHVKSPLLKMRMCC